MADWQDIGRALVFFGVIIILSGILILLIGKIPLLGRLPGDITIHTKKFNFYFPVATSIIISIFLTFIINAIFRHKK